MPKFHIERSIDINAPAEKVRSAIQDYQHWVTWSPWLCMEPEAKLEFEGTAAIPGHAYSWEGDMVGAGRMQLASIDGTADNMDLTFLKPFKSTAKVRFETTGIDNNNTRVSWHMDSGLPFFMFFMVNTMKAMIGMDYERGLKLLKEFVETGEVTSNTEIVGIVDVAELHYVGVSAESNISNLSESMQGVMPKLMQQAEGKTTQNMIGTIYTTMNLKSQHCEYTAFAPVNEADATGTISGCRALKVVHTGSYQHLGNAWSTANTYLRHKKMKASKQVAPFEFYTNDPATVAAKDAITEVYLPIKA